MYTCLIVDYALNHTLSFQMRIMKTKETTKGSWEEMKKKKQSTPKACVCITSHRDRFGQWQNIKWLVGKILQANLCGTWINGDLNSRKKRLIEEEMREETTTTTKLYSNIVAVATYAISFIDCLRSSESVLIFDDVLDLYLHDNKTDFEVRERERYHVLAYACYRREKQLLTGKTWHSRPRQFL